MALSSDLALPCRTNADSCERRRTLSCWSYWGGSIEARRPPLVSQKRSVLRLWRSGCCRRLCQHKSIVGNIMSEANQSSGSPSETAREPEAITFAEFLRGRASAAGVTPPDVLRPAGGRNAATVTGSSMGASPPAAVVFRLDRDRPPAGGAGLRLALGIWGAVTTPFFALTKSDGVVGKAAVII